MHVHPWKAVGTWLACLFIVASCASGDAPDSAGGGASGFDSADAGGDGGGGSERRALPRLQAR